MTTYSDIPASPEPRAVYSIAELAALLGVHRATISGYINKGELRAVRLGHRTVRVSHEALMDFLHMKEEETRRDFQARRKGGRQKRGSAG